MTPPEDPAAVACPACGAPVAAGPFGDCPSCLLGLARITAEEPPFHGESSVEILRRVRIEPPEMDGVVGERIQARSTGSGAWAWRNPGLAALLTLCALLLLGGLGGATWQWRRAEAARAEQARALERLRWREVGRWIGEDEPGRAVAWLASRLRARPDYWQAAMYAMSIVDQHPFHVRAGPEVRLGGHAAVPPRLAPGGDWFLAAEEGGPVRALEADTGRERWALPSPAPVKCLAAGIAQAAWGDAAGGVHLVSREGGNSSSLPRALDAVPEDLAFTPDGARLFARSSRGVECWSVADPGKPRSFALGEAPLGATLSVDGARVFAWNAREAAAWRADDGTLLARWAAREKFLTATFCANGSRVALLDGGLGVRTAEVDGGREHPVIVPAGQAFSDVALNRDGTRLTASARGHLLLFYAVDSGLHLSTRSAGGYSTDALWSTPDGSGVAAVSSRDTVSLFDADRGVPRRAPLRFGTGGMSEGTIQVILARDGARLLVARRGAAGEPETAAVWRGTRRAEPRRQVMPGQSGLAGGRLSRDGRLGGIGLNPSGRCYVYELETGRVVFDQPARGPVLVQLFSPDQSRVYAVTTNGWLHGWDLRTGAELWPPSHQPGHVRPAVISDDGATLLAGHNDGVIRAYAAATGRVVAELPHPGEIKTLRFAPDGSGRFVSGSTDGVAHVWSLAGFRRLQTLAGHRKTIIASAWSPDARLVATASYDGTARVWDVASGQPASPPLPHLAWVAHLEFAPDGRFLATGSRDRTVRLWDARTGAPLGAPIQFSADVETVRFTPDSRALLVRHADGFVFLDAPGGEPVTVDYREPSSSGLGLDSESFRDVLLPDAAGVFLAAALDHGVTWSVPQPRGMAPEWFAGALESIAGLRVDEAGEFRAAPAASAAELLARVPAGDRETPHARWLRRVLAEP